jgi:hypothetical protein
VPARDQSPRKGWVSASDLAEQAYCPRAYWYRYHPPSREAARRAESDPRRASGVTYHTRFLEQERRQESGGATVAWAAFVLGIAFVLAALYWSGYR